jgi:hypothetical protein
VLNAGTLGSTTSISGKVVDGVTKAVVQGGKVVVALERTDSTGVDRIIMETVPDSAGNFSFCPVPAGSYDVVAVAINGAGVAYAATVTTGVQPGNTLTEVPLVAQTGTSTSPATITGQVTTAKSLISGTPANITLSTLQGISQTVMVTVPQVTSTSALLSLATGTNSFCSSNTQCANYTVQVPAMNPNLGAFNASGTTYTQATGSVTFVVDALAFVPNSSNTANCSPSEQKTTAQAVTAGGTLNAPVVAFTQCQ